MRKGVLVLIAGSLAIGWLAAPAWAQGHKITGTMTLTDGYRYSSGAIGETCTASDGYSDISEGVTVKVRDAKDKVIGVGSLRSGQYSDGGFVDKYDDTVGINRSVHVSYCVFPFSVTVPDSSIYSVEVSHRGSLTYSKKQIARKGWKVELSLGS